MIIMVWQCWRKLRFSLMASSESFWIILGFSLVVFLYLLRAVKPFSWRFGKVFFCITPMLIVLKKNFTTSQAILEYFLVCLVIFFFISWKLFVWVLMKICTYILNNTLWWLLHYKSLGGGGGGGGGWGGGGGGYNFSISLFLEKRFVSWNFDLYLSSWHNCFAVVFTWYYFISKYCYLLASWLILFCIYFHNNFAFAYWRLNNPVEHKRNLQSDFLLL